MILDFYQFIGISEYASTFSKILLIMNFVFSVFVPLAYITQNIYSLLGLFCNPKKHPENKKKNKFGYIICAHNEEKVIANLINSIKEQEYSSDLIDIFVICDNCTDQTYNISKNLGCYTFERKSSIELGKCYALDFIIKKINREYQYLNIDVFVFMDADNLITKDYTSKMNDCYNNGYDVATSYRNGKNFSKNWLAGCSALNFMRECEIVHKGRSILGIGTYISGTGFFLSSKIMHKLDGWPFTALIEDIEFSIWCSTEKIKIGYQHDAVFYDEQPTNLKDFINQRLRWCRGNHQCFIRHFKDLLNGIFKKRSFSSFEMLTHVSPIPCGMFLWMVTLACLLGINALVYQLSFNEFIYSGILLSINYLIAVCGITLFHGLVTIIRSFKRIKCNKFKIFIYWLLFPIYMVLFLLISVAALFINVKWEKVEHEDVSTISEIENCK